MIDIKEKSKCCGCSACVKRCPKQCITLLEDDEGFLYPKVDTSICINCGLCEKVCLERNPFDSIVPLHTYAAINPNEEVRMNSSSGGVFTMLAERFISEGGVVFGARYDKDWQVVLDYTETQEGLSAFRGSKYVQARTEDTFQECAQFLKDGRKVMFSGTPCQIAGLKHYLGREYDNLLTVDFLCHGVPSPKVWRKYLEEVVGIANMQGVSMRDKRQGWKRFNFVLDYKQDDNMVTLSSCHRENDYMKAFLQNMILRPSCHACMAKEFKSHSDITIADFWGIQRLLPDMDDDRGTGLVIVNTKKGDDVFSGHNVIYREVALEDARRNNEGFRNAVVWPRRMEFFSKLDKSESVIMLIRETLRPTAKMQLKRYLSSLKRLPKRMWKKLSGGG